MSKFCAKCNKEGNRNEMVRKTKIVTRQGYASSGCSMKAYYYCTSCAPKDDSEIPDHKPTMVIGQRVNNGLLSSEPTIDQRELVQTPIVVQEIVVQADYRFLLHDFYLVYVAVLIIVMYIIQ